MVRWISWKMGVANLEVNVEVDFKVDFCFC